MEQDKTSLYQPLGMCGVALSSEDVRLLHHEVFHRPSNIEETMAAIQKIAGSGSSWSCVGENVLDVLVEMESEREKKEKLFWDLQLLNVGNLHTLYETDYPDVIDPRLLNCLHPSPELIVHDQRDSGSVDMDSLQRQRLVLKKELYSSTRGVERVKRSARKSWGRLASEGLRSLLLHSQRQGQNPGIKSQAWGCVTLSDVLLLLGVKYDVATQLLYKEMLQEHYTMNVWDGMPPWQQQKEEEGLEDLAEAALESGDMISLAELPGAFRQYSVCVATSLRSSREQSWTAVSLLFELHTCRQQEREKLEVLCRRLDGKSLTLLSLYIRLATLRAEREDMSYKALLAAQQSWETWPHVRSSCRVDQALLLLHVQKEDQERGIISVSPQQAVLQLLVLTQEKEREHLVRLVQGLSLEDLQEPVCRVDQEDDSNNQAALRNGCIKMLKQVHSGLWSHTTNPELQIQADISDKPAKWTQHQVEDCSLVLLTHLMELQEAQVSAVLPVLMEESAQCVQPLLDDYESQLQEGRYTNLLTLLITSDPTCIEKSWNEESKTQSCCSEPDEAQNRSSKDVVTDSIKGADAALNGEQAENETGYGAIMEDVPYLEILCISDSKSNNSQSQEIQVDKESSTTIRNQDYEMHGSLIALAWSKPPEDDADCEAIPAGHSKDAESSLEMQILSSNISGTVEHTECDDTNRDLKPTGDPDAHTTDQQCSTVTELIFKGRTLHDQAEKSEFVSEYVLPLHEEETLQDEHHLVVDPPGIKQNATHLSSGLTDEITDVKRMLYEGEVGSTTSQTAVDGLREPESALVNDYKFNLQSKEVCSPRETDPTLREREGAGEPVSVLERERTMRNLVDMQRKVEQRQQRDRQRQMLRVQERLSIIQNRKAEEDLLGLNTTDRLRHLTDDLPQEDKNQQKTLVRERLEQLRRERSYVMQSKRDRNTAGFKELLGPVALQNRETEDGTG